MLFLDHVQYIHPTYERDDIGPCSPALHPDMLQRAVQVPPQQCMMTSCGYLVGYHPTATAGTSATTCGHMISLPANGR